MLAGTTQVDCSRLLFIPTSLKDYCAARNVDGCLHERKCGDENDRPKACPARERCRAITLPRPIRGSVAISAHPPKSVAALRGDRSRDASEYPVYLTGEAGRIEQRGDWLVGVAVSKCERPQSSKGQWLSTTRHQGPFRRR